MWPYGIATAGSLGALVLAWIAAQRYLRSLTVQQRLFAAINFDESPSAPPDEVRGILRRWLFLAGYRAPQAPGVFLAITLLLGAVGLGFLWFIHHAGVVDQLVLLLVSIPGGVGEVFLPVAFASPWLSLSLFAGAPALVVRAARQKRVAQVEQDLPITLDLLATLAEAGVAFDAGVARVLASQDESRPLSQELRWLQRDMLAGRARVEALRRMAWRLNVPWLTIFISAVVQAEQIGASLADVLRTQADDLRQRRRERALAFANAVPVKVLFPLIICFLPGIFVVGVGPTFYQIFQAIDGLLAPWQGLTP